VEVIEDLHEVLCASSRVDSVWRGMAAAPPARQLTPQSRNMASRRIRRAGG